LFPFRGTYLLLAAAFMIATMPTLVASGRWGHACTMLAKSGSFRLELPESASEFASR
jgi:hypothetical protein